MSASLFVLGVVAGMVLGYIFLWEKTSLGKWWKGRKK